MKKSKPDKQITAKKFEQIVSEMLQKLPKNSEYLAPKNEAECKMMLIKNGYVVIEGKRVRLTASGQALMNFQI